MTQKTCPISGQTFQIPEWDAKFHEKMGVPAPALSVHERERRRLSWRNERHLYKRKCDATGKDIISIYHPDQPFPVYDQHYFWGDDWDPLQYGQDFDFSRPFFDQFYELMQKVPRISTINKQSQNSDYCNYSQKNKNCYLTFGAHFNEDLCYVQYSAKSRNCLDCLWIHDCELCYECLDMHHCYNTRYAQNCNTCTDAWFLKNCIGCKNCFGCVNLRNKEYYFLNQPMGKEAYAAKLQSLNLGSAQALINLRHNFQDYIKRFPHKSIEGTQNENVTGNYLQNCKNCENCFELTDGEDCRNVFISDVIKDSLDVSHAGYDPSELCYEMIGCSANVDCRVCESCWHDPNIDYCGLCFHSSNLFGCISLRNKKHCIFNKQYSEADYQTLREKIIAHMKETSEWGEFFPTKYSPYAYNESVAQRYYPLSKEEVLVKGWKWKDDLDGLPLTRGTTSEASQGVPDTIEPVTDDILNQNLVCQSTGKSYKIVKPELQFYRQMNLPLPKVCPDERNRRRVDLRPKWNLYERKCEGCGERILTAYSENLYPRIRCEACYLEATD